MVCGTADILMKFLSLGWFGLGYDCFCKRLHSRKLIKKAIPKEASTRCFLGLGFLSARMLGVEVLVCLIAMALASSPVLTKVTTHGLVVLLLIVVALPCVDAVACVHCNGFLPECQGSDKCPMHTGVANNAAAMASATAAAITLVGLLPSRVLRALPRAAIDAIKAVVKVQAARDAQFDFEAAGLKEIFDATIQGRVSTTDALVALQHKLMAEDIAKKCDKIIQTMSTIKDLKKSKDMVIPEKTDVVQGAFLFVWALTGKCTAEGEPISVGTDLSGDSEVKAATAKLVRPATMAEFMARLNFWVMLCHALGLANVLISAAFLEDVVYGPLRKGKDWKVVHELLVVYLRSIADHEKYTLFNIFETGGQDTKWREAEASMAANFRGTRGDPADKPGTIKKLSWNCACTGSINKPCISFNLKKDHIDAAIENGKCKYVHSCDAWVTGPDGQKAVCGSTAHGRSDCDNPNRITK